MLRRSLGVSLLAGSIGCAGCSAVPVQAAEPQAYTIPSQDLESALLKLAQISGHNILFSPDTVRGTTSGPVVNAPNFDVALHEMLTGTRMIETASGDSVIIRPQPADVPPSRKSTPGPTDNNMPRVDAADMTEVTVTARKTRERLNDVPIAVTALSGSQLNLQDHRRIEDLSSLVPSTNFVITNGHQASFSIRGLGTNPGNDGLEGSAGVFLDGVHLGRPGMAAMDLIDINQIEVLRGPQGTLFGKNTTAGAVNITTEVPSFQFGGRAQATYGNYNFQQYQGTVTGPLLQDEVAGRLTAFSTKRNGTVYDVSTAGHVGTLDRRGIRGQLLLTPGPDFSIRLIGEYEREQQSTGALVIIPGWGATPAALQAKFNAVGAYFVPDPSGSTTYDGWPDATGTRQSASSAEINWKIGDFTVTSLSAYRWWRYRSSADSDGTAADALGGGFNISDNQWSEELRVKFPRMGPVDAIAGLYYFGQNLRVDAITRYGGEAAAWLTAIPDALLPTYAARSQAVAALLNYNHTRWDVDSTPSTDSYAVFGQAVWHLTSNWNLTSGVRETYEAKSETVWRQTPVSTQSGQPVTALSPMAHDPFDVSIHDAAPSFLISSDYHFTPDQMLYTSVAQSEKAGGVNTTLPSSGQTIDSLKVRPETATNYEIGLRSEQLEHRVRIAMAAFLTNVRDYQATYLSTINNQTVSLLTNVGKVRSRGLEAEGTATPVMGLTLSATASFNDAKYASYPSAPCPAGTVGATSCNLTGRPVAGAPKWIANVNVGYEHPLSSKFTGYGLAEYSFRSRYFGYLDDSPGSLTGGYSLVNLRAGMRTADERWDVSLWGKNVTNRHYVANYLTYGSVLPGTYAAFFGDFATYGLTLRANF
jgi:iron complex outermembrane receptor protein